MATMGQIPQEKPKGLWEWIKEHLLPDFFVKLMSDLFSRLTTRYKP